MNKPGKHTTTAPTEVRISVTNFGPITSGIVNLRPLTVFVGPSNSGKTYFAILIYALHRILHGFPRFPVMDRRRSHFWRDLRYEESQAPAADVKEKELRDVLKKLETEERSFKFSDLPGSLCDVAQAVLKDRELLGEELRIELKRCFDIESVSDLVRLSGQQNEMKVSLEVREDEQRLWHFRMGTSKSGITTNGHIEDMVLLPEGRQNSKFNAERLFRRFQWLSKEVRGIDSPRRRWYVFEELLELIFHMNAALATQGGTHYLPAARSGIMQSHRVIASSLVARSTRAGLERLELPTLSGVMVDFMQQLILYEEHRGSDRPMNALADALEREALAGRIRASRPPSGGYPEFAYRPRGTKKDIRLTRASSMVSELAPVVLFLRGAVDSGDMLIIEEPEAHLHPAAQTLMAVTLARMVRAGVRVVVTTHSDWLLKEIGNLMREGELELREKTGKPARKESFPSALRPSEVGIWLFRRDKLSAGSTVEEIPFDRSEGVEPQDYENVAEALYNRSADLQNRFEETARDVEREHE